MTWAFGAMALSGMVATLAAIVGGASKDIVGGVAIFGFGVPFIASMWIASRHLR